MNGRQTERTTRDPSRAADKPKRPTAPAVMMEGVIPIVRVTNRCFQGAMDHWGERSQTIWNRLCLANTSETDTTPAYALSLSR